MHQMEMLFGPSLRDCGVMEHTRFDTFMLRFHQTHIMKKNIETVRQQKNGPALRGDARHSCQGH